jgi:hypothetical protein
MNYRLLIRKNILKPIMVCSVLALFLGTTGGSAFGEDKSKKASEKSKQTVENIVNYGTVKSSGTTTSESSSEKAKPGDSATDFKPKQTLKTKEVPAPSK